MLRRIGAIVSCPILIAIKDGQMIGDAVGEESLKGIQAQQITSQI
jgi:hypothetical protein